MPRRSKVGGLKSLLLGWAAVLGYCIVVAVGPPLIFANGAHAVTQSGGTALVASASY
jgi:hypothetical protein